MPTESRKPSFFSVLSSMKLGLLLLLILGGMASLGSLVPQAQPPQFYQAYYGALSGRIITFIGLDHVYRSWWFIVTGALLTVNLLTCSIKRIKKVPGLQGWGSIILHLSILVILAGAFISGLLGRSNYIEIGNGDVIDLGAYGFPGYSLQLKGFRIEYYENMQPKQYISDISLITAEGDEFAREIMVNRPLKVGDLKIYQTSYGWLVRGQVLVKDNWQPFDLKSGRAFVVDPNKNERLVFYFIPDGIHPSSPLPSNPRLIVTLFREQQVLAREILAEKETKNVGGYAVTFFDYRYYSGLTLKKDPGIGVLYAGFIVLLVGLILRYLSPEKRQGVDK